jgi:hypothetical protein
LVSFTVLSELADTASSWMSLRELESDRQI